MEGFYYDYSGKNVTWITIIGVVIHLIPPPLFIDQFPPPIVQNLVSFI